ncbi:MAG: hypothetical protein K6B70_03120 [Clostridia bacterium]|nr:hypothetical protein [Clostridia bacterium]
MEKHKAELKSRNGVIIFLIILVLVFASAFVATSVYVIREKKGTKSTQESITFSSLTGLYVGDAKVEPGTTPNGETKVRLYLYEDGCFEYYNQPGIGAHIIGYYTFKDNELVLHEVVGCANDPGRSIIDGTKTMKINDDKSFADSKLNATLTKSSDKFENQTSIMSKELKTALDNKFLD